MRKQIRMEKIKHTLFFSSPNNFFDFKLQLNFWFNNNKSTKTTNIFQLLSNSWTIPTQTISMKILKASSINHRMRICRIKISCIKTAVSFCMIIKMTIVVNKDYCLNWPQIIMRVNKVHIRCLTLKFMMKLSHKNRKL